MSQTLTIKKLRLKSCQIINCVDGDHITSQILKHGVYDRNLVGFLDVFLEENKNLVCVDVGANIGAITLPMAQKSKKIISFEPIKEIYELLKMSIQENKIENCSILNMGLSNEKKLTPISINTNGNIGASSIHADELKTSSQGYNEQQMIDLDLGDNIPELKSSESIDLIKIDVEGHECNVLQGLMCTIERHRPVIILEWNNDLTRSILNHGRLQHIFDNYTPCTLRSKKDIFHKKVKNNKYTKPFRIILRALYKLFMSKKNMNLVELQDDFDPTDSYSNVVFIPNNRRFSLDGL